jgi:hypothetical protein
MKKRFISLAAVYIIFPAMLLAQPTGKKQLVGIWEVKVLPVGQSQSPLLSLAMFGGDGKLHHGRWIQSTSSYLTDIPRTQNSVGMRDQ